MKAILCFFVVVVASSSEGRSNGRSQNAEEVYAGGTRHMRGTLNTNATFPEEIQTVASAPITRENVSLQNAEFGQFKEMKPLPTVFKARDTQPYPESEDEKALESISPSRMLRAAKKNYPRGHTVINPFVTRSSEGESNGNKTKENPTPTRKHFQGKHPIKGIFEEVIQLEEVLGTNTKKNGQQLLITVGDKPSEQRIVDSSKTKRFRIAFPALGQSQINLDLLQLKESPQKSRSQSSQIKRIETQQVIDFSQLDDTWKDRRGKGFPVDEPGKGSPVDEPGEYFPIEQVTIATTTQEDSTTDHTVSSTPKTTNKPRKGKQKFTKSEKCHRKKWEAKNACKSLGESIVLLYSKKNRPVSCDKMYKPKNFKSPPAIIFTGNLRNAVEPLVQATAEGKIRCSGRRPKYTGILTTKNQNGTMEVAWMIQDVDACDLLKGKNDFKNVKGTRYVRPKFSKKSSEAKRTYIFTLYRNSPKTKLKGKKINMKKFKMNKFAKKFRLCGPQAMTKYTVKSPYYKHKKNFRRVDIPKSLSSRPTDGKLRKLMQPKQDKATGPVYDSFIDYDTYNARQNMYDDTQAYYSEFMQKPAYGTRKEVGKFNNEKTL